MKEIIRKYVIIEEEYDCGKEYLAYVDTEEEAKRIVKELNDEHWWKRPRKDYYYETIVPWKEIEEYYLPNFRNESDVLRKDSK